MSVTTVADGLVQSAKENINTAVKKLLEAIHPDTWGQDNFSLNYEHTLLEIITELKKVYNKL